MQHRAAAGADWPEGDTMSRYPGAEWVPWLYIGASGRPAFYRGGNLPSAVVLHIMEGYVSTVRGWARTGYAEASWHFSIGRDGAVYQHLELTDGGYHAGITDARAAARPPVWPLWRGPGVNVNFYTIGIEHEGFTGPRQSGHTGGRAAARASVIPAW